MLPLTTVWLSTSWVSAPLLAAKLDVPLYAAVMLSSPSVVKLVVQAATPLALSAAAPQPLISVPPFANSTVPVVTGEPELVTVAVNVTELFSPEVNDGLGLDDRLVLVDAALAVAMLTDHPPSIPAPVPPPSPSAFSVTNSFHVPLGSEPLKALASVAEPVGAAFEKLGAGEGKVSFVAPFVKSLVKSAGLIVTDPLSPVELLVPRLESEGGVRRSCIRQGDGEPVGGILWEEKTARPCQQAEPVALWVLEEHTQVRQVPVSVDDVGKSDGKVTDRTAQAGNRNVRGVGA